jgi:pyridoxine 4-dehydrogenase
MNFTWRPQPIPTQTAFDVLNEAIKINLPNKTFLNAGELYGPDCLNLKYLQQYFQKYPEQRQNVVISVKGAVNTQTFAPLVDRDGIHASIDNVLKYIPDLEIFEPARLNPEVPLEITIAALDEAVDLGKIKGYTLSEVNAATLAKAAKLSKHGISGVEVELSLFTRDVLENGLAETAGKLDIPIVAYSPLSRGFLTGSIKAKSDIPEGDIRNHLERFNEENIKKNSLIVEKLQALAEEKKITAAQLALAWIRYHSGKEVDNVKYPKIIPIPSSSSVGRVQENFKKVQLTEDVYKSINDVISGLEVSGHRYNEHAKKYLSL